MRRVPGGRAPTMPSWRERSRPCRLIPSRLGSVDRGRRRRPDAVRRRTRLLAPAGAGRRDGRRTGGGGRACGRHLHDVPSKNAGPDLSCPRVGRPLAPAGTAKSSCSSRRPARRRWGVGVARSRGAGGRRSQCERRLLVLQLRADNRANGAEATRRHAGSLLVAQPIGSERLVVTRALLRSMALAPLAIVACLAAARRGAAAPAATARSW